MIGGTGLLTRDGATETAPSHPRRQWLAGRVVRRSQLRGSGGVSPRFPFIPPVAFSLAILRTRFLSAPRCLLQKDVSAAPPWPDLRFPGFLVWRRATSG